MLGGPDESFGVGHQAEDSAGAVGKSCDGINGAIGIYGEAAFFAVFINIFERNMSL